VCVCVCVCVCMCMHAWSRYVSACMCIQWICTKEASSDPGVRHTDRCEKADMGRGAELRYLAWAKNSLYSWYIIPSSLKILTNACFPWLHFYRKKKIKAWRHNITLCKYSTNHCNCNIVSLLSFFVFIELFYIPDFIPHRLQRPVDPHLIPPLT
jgi:hypothetical protein